ncbi:MAG: hypothetical protein SFU56_15285 [Capsulimonadales bacterium]|nr:hypothetical protein [Capsulimonadales bacterium]
MFKQRAFIGAILIAAGLMPAAVARQGNGAPPTVPGGTQIGQFRVAAPTGQLELVTSTRKNVWQLDLTDRVVTITSRRYDISARKITLIRDIKRGLVTNARANTEVRVVVRDPGRTTTLTCNTAVYRVAEGDAPTRIDVEGNVRVVQRDATFAADDPFVTTGEKGFVEFLDADTTRIVITKPTLSGTPIEPKAKPAPDGNP